LETLGKVGSVFSNPERARKFLTFTGCGFARRPGDL
jgi:hypothetical protein